MLSFQNNLSIIVLGKSSSHFLEMTMPVRKVDSLKEEADLPKGTAEI